MIVATLAIVAAWLFGYVNAGVDAAPLASKVLPGAVTINRSGDFFVGRDVAGAVMGYAGVGSGSGYAGPLQVLVGVAPDGRILGVEMVEERESPGFFRLVRSSKFFESYGARKMQDALTLGQDLDAVSGATLSAEGVAAAVRAAVASVAADALQTPLPPRAQPINAGLPEVILVLLFVSGYLSHKLRAPRPKKLARWGTLLAGMLLIGFVYTLPLTISMVVSLLSGYWPDWHTNLYWYILIGGIIFVTTVDAKNPYCSWFCPFGAFQECLAAITKAKAYRPHQLSEPLKWVQRGLALTAIVLGLALRNPGAAGYEPFATLFDLRGTTLQWALLVMIVLASLMMHRPFCNYLCPIDPVIEFVAAGRRWIKETWNTWRNAPRKRTNTPTNEGQA